jgi:hypothetical protein
MFSRHVQRWRWSFGDFLGQNWLLNTTVLFHEWGRRQKMVKNLGGGHGGFCGGIISWWHATLKWPIFNSGSLDELARIANFVTATKLRELANIECWRMKYLFLLMFTNCNPRFSPHGNLEMPVSVITRSNALLLLIYELALIQVISKRP